MNKKQLGQFFTKNSNYILQGLEKHIKGKNVIDPFAGSGDLIVWAKKNGAKRIKGYDVDKNCADNKDILYNDSINSPLKYEFVLTNPPYLNINKADKEIKEKYFKESSFEDLYQISLYSLLNSEEGIIIVPVNFLSADNSKRIRNVFFDKFEIVEMNYFRERVFSDTTYNVIAFYYRKKKDLWQDKLSIKTRIYPDNKIMQIELNKKYSWRIGGEFLNVIKNQKNELGIYRLTEKDIENNSGDIGIRAAHNHIKDTYGVKISGDFYDLLKNNIILLKAIDSGSKDGKLALEDIKKYGVECLVSKESSRHMIYLIFNKEIPVSHQKEIIDIFNKEINKMRDNYFSLFLTNYRDKNRKRVSFDFVYKFINYIYSNKISRDNNLLIKNI